MATPTSVFNGTGTAAELGDTLIPEKYQVILLSFAYGIISLLAVGGNSCIIYIVIRNRRMHSVTNYFICNLALSDCLVACFAVPFQVGRTFPPSRIHPHAAILLLVSSGRSSKMGIATFPLQISAICSNPLRRCVDLHTCRRVTRSLPCDVAPIETEAVHASGVYDIYRHLAYRIGIIDTQSDVL